MDDQPLQNLDFISLWFTPTTTTTTTTISKSLTMPWSVNIPTNISINNDDDLFLNNNNHSSNSSIPGDKPGPLINLAVPLLMFCTGLLGNLVALLLLWRSRRENARSVFYRLVAGLALTDLMGILATSPVTILVYSKDRQWVGGQAMCDYFSFMMIWAGLATVVVVGCMALERFVAILHPYFYERRVNPGRVKLVIAAVWVGAAAFSSLPLLRFGRNVRHYPGTWCFFDYYSDRTVDKVFNLLYASIGLLVIAATAVCNVAVMAVLLRMRRVSKNIGKSSEGRTLNMTSEMQMIFFLAGIILVFATCYSPLMIRVIINASKTVPDNVGADLMAIRLASLNQIMDPWVYLLFRRRLAALLYSACKTVSPLQNMSSLRAFRSEMGQNSPRNSPALRHNSMPSGRASLALRGEDREMFNRSSLVVHNGRCANGDGGGGGGGGEAKRRNDSDTTLVAKNSLVIKNGKCGNGDGGDEGENESKNSLVAKSCPVVQNGKCVDIDGGKDSKNNCGTSLVENGECHAGTAKPSWGGYESSPLVPNGLLANGRSQSNVEQSRSGGESGSTSSLIARPDCDQHCDLETQHETNGNGDYSQLIGRESFIVHSSSEVEKYDDKQNVVRNSPFDPCLDSAEQDTSTEKIVKVSFYSGHGPFLSNPSESEIPEKETDGDTNTGDLRHSTNQTNPTNQKVKTNVNGVKPKNGILRVQATKTQTETLSEAKTDGLLASSTSWPMICRHGNQRVIGVNSDSENGRPRECQPLLNEQMDTFCSQCKRTNKDTAFV
ncbi:uncharacterized protein [Littorina saxatilis]|uniref:Prostaglandin E2 receptor EP4 subtype n=1 Tax=Littorina saxatilis TaxID=31220 RepID=A0AAN9AMU2_9CAEN